MDSTLMKNLGKVIEKNLQFLVGNTKNLRFVTIELLAQGILTLEERKTIFSFENKIDQNLQFYNLLLRRPSHLPALITTLQFCGENKIILEKLEDDLKLNEIEESNQEFGFEEQEIFKKELSYLTRYIINIDEVVLNLTDTGDLRKNDVLRIVKPEENEEKIMVLFEILSTTSPRKHSFENLVDALERSDNVTIAYVLNWRREEKRGRRGKLEDFELIGLPGQRRLFLGLNPNGFEFLKRISLIHVEIPGSLLTSSLQLTPQLEVLIMRAVNFSSGIRGRVNLPYLYEFILEELKEEVNSFESFVNHVTSRRIANMIFFDKGYMHGSDLDFKNLGVKISVKLSNFTIVSFDGSEIVLLGNDHENLLMKIKMADVSSVALGGGHVTLSSLPKCLNYLNLYRVKFLEQDITKLLSNLTQLTHFYFFPFDTNSEISIDLSNFPKTISQVSLGFCHLFSSMVNLRLSLVSLTLSLCRFSENFVINFRKLVDVKNFAIFGIEETRPTYELIGQVLETSAESIFVVFLEKRGICLEEMEEGKRKVEENLRKFSFSHREVNFWLRKSVSGHLWEGVGLTLEEIRERWQKFIHVHKFGLNFQM